MYLCLWITHSRKSQIYSQTSDTETHPQRAVICNWRQIKSLAWIVSQDRFQSKHIRFSGAIFQRNHLAAASRKFLSLSCKNLHGFIVLQESTMEVLINFSSMCFLFVFTGKTVRVRVFSWEKSNSDLRRQDVSCVCMCFAENLWSLTANSVYKFGELTKPDNWQTELAWEQPSQLE